MGREITTRGNFMLNGHRVHAFVSLDLSQNLLPTLQVDWFLGGVTIQFGSRSITFVPDEKQKQK